MSDRVFGGLGILLSAFFIYQAINIEISFMSDSIGPRLFPIVLGVVLGLASLAMMIWPDPFPDWPDFRGVMEIAVSLAFMIAYAVILPKIGFVAATFAVATYLSWRLGAQPARAAVAAAVMSVAIYVSFEHVLGISLAQGPWGF